MSTLFDHTDAPPAEFRSLATGEHLFRLGDPVAALHEVVEGEIVLDRISEEGARLVLQRAGVGKIVAEASLFATSYHCDAIAASPSGVRRIGVGALRAHLNERPNALWALAQQLAHEVQRNRLRVQMLSMRRIADRLDAWLIMNDGALPPKGRRRLLAAEIGVTPEALYRELARRQP